MYDLIVVHTNIDIWTNIDISHILYIIMLYIIILYLTGAVLSFPCQTKAENQANKYLMIIDMLLMMLVDAAVFSEEKAWCLRLKSYKSYWCILVYWPSDLTLVPDPWSWSDLGSWSKIPGLWVIYEWVCVLACEWVNDWIGVVQEIWVMVVIVISAIFLIYIMLVILVTVISTINNLDLCCFSRRVQP